MTVFEGFQLTLNCDFIAVADRKYCQVFYGRERLLGEDIAAYTFLDDMSFDKALKTATALSGNPVFEKLWSAKQFDDRPGGYICLKRKVGGSFLHQIKQANRYLQFRYCKKLVKAIAQIHEQGRAHGGLDEDNVIFDERTQGPVVLEVLSGFHADQLDPTLCAPEQQRDEPATSATDVYWLAHLYLSAIRRPGHKLRQLIRRCMADNPEDRPRMSVVAKTFKEIYSQDLTLNVRRWFFNPQLAMKFAGVAMLLVASTMLLFRNDAVKAAPQMDLEANLKAELDKTARIPSSISGIRKLLDQAESEEKVLSAIDILVNKASSNVNLAKPVLQILQDRYIEDLNTFHREQIIHGISEIHVSMQIIDQEVTQSVDSLQDSLIGVMLFNWPIIITNNGVWQLGDWGVFNGFEGYISKISLDEVIIKNGRDIHIIGIENPPGLTRLDWMTKNIYVRLGQPNLHKIINAFSVLGYDIIENGNGGSDGYLGGYFNFENPEDFLTEVSNHLGISHHGRTIWIQDVKNFRSYIPIEIYSLKGENCLEIFNKIFMNTGINFSVNSTCEDGPLNIYVTFSEIKDLIQSMGYQWHLGTELDKTGVIFHTKE